MNDFEEIKRAADLKTIIPSETGLQMGKNHLESCPFCDGHDCFSINTKKQQYKCFQCDTGGDIFDFLAKYHGITEQESLQQAANLVGHTLFQHQKSVRLSKNDKLLLSAAEYYHHYMLVNGAKDYLVGQRGHSMTTLELMKVGWSDGRLFSHLQKQGFAIGEILESGLVREDKKKPGRHYDFFGKGLAIFPHFENGRALHFTIKDPEKKRPPYQLPATQRNKRWRFYNQDSLFRYDELILVEGKNDTLSVVDSGVRQVIGMSGQISEEQIKSLAAHCKSKKHLYLWMDNDFDHSKPYTKGYGYVRKISEGLPGVNIRIFIYPDNFNDPDEYLQHLPRDKRRNAICRLREESVDYLTWEIMQAEAKATLEDKVEHLKQFNLFQQIGQRPHIDQQIYIEKLEELGLKLKSIDQELESGGGLRQRITEYLENLNSKRDANPNTIADLIHDHFSGGGRFFRDDDDKVYLMWQHNIYEVSTNRPFNALIKRKTGLLPTEQPGRSVWESLASEGYNSGRQIDLGGWLHTDRGTDTVYINLNSSNNIIIKITPAGVEEIQNGLNQDHILLQSSGKIKPFNYLPETTIEEAVSELRKLLFDNLSCETTQKYLLLSWFISTFVSDFSPHVAPLLKAAGETASGKTTAARLLEYLLYGDEHLGEISVAGAYADASQNPMLVIDNLENQDIKQEMLKFLLLVATRGSKVKRKGGTESGVTEESPKALVMVTAIEPFVKSELINRTFEVNFAKQYHNEGFIDDEVTRQILKKRDIIISGLLKLIQKEILPNLKKRTAYITALNVDHKGHSKERMNAYLALMMLILDRVLIYWDVKQHLKAPDIWHTWIITQDQLAREHEVSSNDILRLLDGLIREYRLRMNEQELKPQRVYGYEEEVYQYTHPEYGIAITRTAPTFIDENKEHTEAFIEFEATSKDLTYAFTRFCKNNGLANPYSSAAIFGSRLKNDRKLLAKGGWELVTKEENGTYFKVVRGQRYLRFRHRLIR